MGVFAQASAAQTACPMFTNPTPEPGRAAVDSTRRQAWLPTPKLTFKNWDPGACRDPRKIDRTVLPFPRRGAAVGPTAGSQVIP
eukprot:2192484-Heterocapsa_arctica.AAC.1